jgi:hypothetical protein
MICRYLAAVMALALLVPAWIDRVVAQPEAKAAKAKQKEPKKAVVKGRLPAYFGPIVNEGQRQRIYQIQASYNPKIEALQTELDALVAQRDNEIRAVLSPEQREQLEARIADAQAKKAAKAEKKAAEKKRNVVPVNKAG